MKLIEHGKYYSDTMNVRCEECRCLYEITKEESHREYYNLCNNNILVEAEKIYFIDELLESKGE